MKFPGVKPGKPIVVTLTPEEGLALLNQYSNKNKSKCADENLCTDKTPNPDEVKSMKTSEIESIFSKASPQLKKRQHKTANCVICLSSLIPKNYFDRKKRIDASHSKARDSDQLIIGSSKPEKYKDKPKSSSRSSTMLNPNLAQLPNCGHLFHEDCLQKWDCYTCPICRTRVDINRKQLIMEDAQCQKPTPTAVPQNQLNQGPVSISGSSDPSGLTPDPNNALSCEEVKIEVRKSGESLTDQNLGFPFQQSIRNTNSTGGRLGLQTAKNQAYGGMHVNLNSRQIPVLGCLEEGKEEDGQSGVGDEEDLELASMRSQTNYEDSTKKTAHFRSAR